VACKILIDDVLAWLFLWSGLQMIAYCPADATATPSSLASLKSRSGLTVLVPAYTGCSGQEAIKRVLLSMVITVTLTGVSY